MPTLSQCSGVESQKRHNTPFGWVHRFIIQTAIQHGSYRCTRFRSVHTHRQEFPEAIGAAQASTRQALEGSAFAQPCK
jgi:hypothetical protein